VIGLYSSSKDFGFCGLKENRKGGIDDCKVKMPARDPHAAPPFTKRSVRGIETIRCAAMNG
jgi:hypothetical protein